jgi:hypothetical protein
VAVITLAAGYAALFYSAPLADLRGNSRASALGQMLLLPDEVAANWTGDPAEFAIVDRLRVIVPALALFGVCGLAGTLVMRATRADRGLTPAEHVFFACGVGFGVVSLYTFLVGIAGGLHVRALFVAPGLALTVWGLVGLWQFRGKYRAKTSGTHAEVANERDNATNWLWWAAPFVIVIVMGGSLTPVDFDVREYHLQVPKEFYLNGHIGFLPHTVYGNMPLGTEMLPLAAMVTFADWWFGALVGKVVIALAAPLTALGLMAAGQRFVSTTAGVVAALVYISTPWIVRVSTLGLMEGFSSLYLWGTVYAVVNWWRDERGNNTSRLLLAGFLAGSGAACKYPNVLYILLPAALVVVVRAWRPWHSSQQNASSDAGWTHRTEWVRPIMAFALASSVACGPWFVKNWILTGNPVYPLAFEVFGGQTRDAELNAQWTRAHRPPGFGAEELFESAANVAWRSPWISPLVLPLALLGVATSCYRRLAVGLAVYAFYVFAIWWLLTHRIDRFWIPILPVLAFLAGLAVSPGALVRWHWPIKSALGTMLAANLLLIVGGGGGDISYFVSLASLNRDPLRVNAGHQYLNAHLSPKDTVLTVGDAEVFDLRMPVLYNTVFDRERFETLMVNRTSDERKQALADLGVTYVAVSWSEVDRYRSPGNYGFTDYIQPALFDNLVKTGVLAPALVLADDEEAGRRYQIFPVPGASTVGE